MLLVVVNVLLLAVVVSLFLLAVVVVVVANVVAWVSDAYDCTSMALMKGSPSQALLAGSCCLLKDTPISEIPAGSMKLWDIAVATSPASLATSRVGMTISPLISTENRRAMPSACCLGVMNVSAKYSVTRWRSSAETGMA